MVVRSFSGSLGQEDVSIELSEREMLVSLSSLEELSELEDEIGVLELSLLESELEEETLEEEELFPGSSQADKTRSVNKAIRECFFISPAFYKRMFSFRLAIT